MLSEEKSGSTGKVTISSASADLVIVEAEALAAEQDAGALPHVRAAAQHPARLDRPAHRLEAVALPRRGGEDEIQVGDRRGQIVEHLRARR